MRLLNEQIIKSKLLFVSSKSVKQYNWLLCYIWFWIVHFKWFYFHLKLPFSFHPVTTSAIAEQIEQVQLSPNLRQLLCNSMRSKLSDRHNNNIRRWWRVTWPIWWWEGQKQTCRVCYDNNTISLHSHLHPCSCHLSKTHNDLYKNQKYIEMDMRMSQNKNIISTLICFLYLSSNAYRRLQSFPKGKCKIVPNQPTVLKI